jgi:ABC-type maltose transport system permease subunit
MDNPPIKISWRRTFSSILLYLAFVVFTLIVLLPVYWMMRSAFASSTDLIKLPLVYFPQPTLRNFATLLEQLPFGLYLRNSLLFAVSTTIATLFVSYLADPLSRERLASLDPVVLDGAAGYRYDCSAVSNPQDPASL